MGSGVVRRRFLVAAAITATLALIPVILLLTGEESAGASTVVTVIHGPVELSRSAGDFTPATDGDLLSVDDAVRTGDGGRAVVTFFDGSTIEMEPATTIEIDEVSGDPNGSVAMSVKQTLGRTWTSIRRLLHAQSKFQLHTPSSNSTVRGTGFITEVLPDGTTTVQTFDGMVNVTAQGQTVVVAAGQITTVSPNAPPADPAAAPSPRNRLRFGVLLPAYVAAVDPFGRTCGLVLPGPTVVRQIPGCLATAAGVQPQLVDVSDAPGGTYQLVFFPAGPPGSYAATAAATSGGNLTFEYAVSGSMTGGRQGARLEVVANSDGTLSANGISAIQALDQSPIKVVLPSVPPSPTAAGTPDLALFARLPTPTLAPTPPTVGPTLVPTSAPAPMPAPTTVALPAPTPTLAPPTASPTPAPAPAPSAIPFVPPGRARTPKPHCPPPKCTAAIALDPEFSA